MKLSKYALFGKPVVLSLSPQIHQQFAESLKESIQYKKNEVDKDNFESEVEKFFKQGGLGLNITVPHKQKAFEIAEMATIAAQQAGAANTLWMVDGRLHADNTDGKGFIKDLLKKNISIKNKEILIIGAGGAVRGIIGPLLLQKPSKIIIANRSIEKAKLLCEQFKTKGNVIACGLPDIQKYTVNIVINGLSLHEFPQTLNFNLEDNSSYYDLKYGEAAASGLSWASKKPFKVVCDGWGMLIAQAAESYFIWRGKRPDCDKAEEALNHLLSSKPSVNANEKHS